MDIMLLLVWEKRGFLFVRGKKFLDSLVVFNYIADMQREIEFRLWDHEDKKMISWDQIVAKGFPASMLVSWPYLCQFTGLLDKNGKKIFEGDIIRHGCTAQEYESVVAYKAPTFIAKTFSYKRENNWRAEKPKEFDVIWEKRGIEAFNEGWYMGDRSFNGENYVEIIGNIFENPEFLKP